MTKLQLMQQLKLSQAIIREQQKEIRKLEGELAVIQLVVERTQTTIKKIFNGE